MAGDGLLDDIIAEVSELEDGVMAAWEASKGTCRAPAGEHKAGCGDHFSGKDSPRVGHSEL